MLPITDAELASRVSQLKRFRELLQKQKTHFEDYITVLDKQRGDIAPGDVDALIAHVEPEEKIAADIAAIQKVVEPLRTVIPAAAIAKAPALSSITSTIEKLRGEANGRIQRNKTLLETRMAEIRNEIKALRANPFARKSPFSQSETPSLIDIMG
jgi:hypothetical protein